MAGTVNLLDSLKSAQVSFGKLVPCLVYGPDSFLFQNIILGVKLKVTKRIISLIFF